MSCDMHAGNRLDQYFDIPQQRFVDAEDERQRENLQYTQSCPVLQQYHKRAKRFDCNVYDFWAWSESILIKDG